MKTNYVAIYRHPGMQALYQTIEQKDHRTLVLWALETGKEVLEIFNTVFPDDLRPGQAMAAAEAWSRGDIKMPAAKKAAKDTHTAATDAKENSVVDASKKAAAVAAAHAMGQVIGVVHVATHATAYMAYAVQAVVVLNPDKDPEEVLMDTVEYLSNRLLYWTSAEKDNLPWATFL